METSETNPDRVQRPGTAAKPFSIRLTEDERSLLIARAGKQPLATYLRDLILTEAAQARRRRSLSKLKDDEALARVLAALGQSRIANNLNQIARAANLGILPVTSDVEQDIAEACAGILAMRHDLLRALGLGDAAST